MRLRMSLYVAAAILVPFSFVHARSRRKKACWGLYFLDTEGGRATFYSFLPQGQSMLVDTGFPGNQGAPPAEAERSRNYAQTRTRIMAVLKLANVDVLDYMVITHFHGDHVGNAAEARPSYSTYATMWTMARTRSKCSRGATLPSCLICRFANMGT